ncbi:MAG: hypothetical protein PHC70_00650 [Patescibacteria group bacterium]|jgi:hypothetical protein|nr:hypothetical protein [Patescibacteria group bacterium]
MKKTNLVISALSTYLLVSLLPTTAIAQTKVKYALMPNEGFLYKDGQTYPLAPSLTQGIAIAHKWGSYGWISEADVVSPFTQANPSLQLVVGPVYFPIDKIFLVPNGSVRYNPEQKGGKVDSLSLGVGFVIGFAVSKEISFGAGLGAMKVVSGEPGPWCFAIGPKMSYTLPF